MLQEPQGIQEALQISAAGYPGEVHLFNPPLGNREGVFPENEKVPVFVLPSFGTVKMCFQRSMLDVLILFCFFSKGIRISINSTEQVFTT